MTDSDQPDDSSRGKGRPTPKRKDAQARRGGPVAPPPTNRREAARQLRDKQAEGRKQVRKGNLTGDETLLLKRDRGPERRLVRDVVDSRRSLGFLLLPTAALVVAAGFSGDQGIANAVLGVWLATILGVALDMLLAGVLLSGALKKAFPDAKRRGHIAYGLLRTTVIRRFRMPRPQVVRGQRVP